MKMRIAVYIGNKELLREQRLLGLISELESQGCGCYVLEDGQSPDSETDMLLSVGGVLVHYLLVDKIT